MESFKDLIQSDQPLLVDFYADWCGPCKAMAPVVSEVAKQLTGKGKVIKIDIDKSPVAANAYQVQAVPTFVIFKKGSIVWRHAGMIDKQKLLEAMRVNA